ncbi:hypothetical protein A2115_02935 [Candidatus Woesebacteria bacterium GWA1_41_8]|uniref:Glycosyltransferase 2-like domain-containing protein n=1 Tax=Candidatus Woesebacteria bacterium GWA1_41_8 TaxID=1802471 RepID=A0A1F7WHS0_9BACT|nr:MAG: hypothetical protein A2115_02935 [Candidatus Woesebacteria bacterium GWA1_41_8]
MKTNPDISIVILNFNSISFLEKCLLSIKQSKLNGIKAEVLVVDNASTDQSVEVLKRKYPEIKLIESKSNRGFAAGNNLARGKVSGKYILFLNPDTELEKNTLLTVFRFMQQAPMVGVATCKLVLPGGTLDYSTHRGFPTPFNAFFYFFTPFSKIFPKTKLFSGYTQGWKLDDPKPHEVDAISGAFFFVRKSAADKVEWWDEDYFWYGEDLEFCYRLKEMGLKVMFLPQTSALHHKGVSSGIKGHSKKISSATKETRLRSALSSTQVMRIFYRKHYEKKYPKVFSFIVFTGIKLLEKIRTGFI